MSSVSGSAYYYPTTANVGQAAADVRPSAALEMIRWVGILGHGGRNGVGMCTWRTRARKGASAVALLSIVSSSSFTSACSSAGTMLSVSASGGAAGRVTRGLGCDAAQPRAYWLRALLAPAAALAAHGRRLSPRVCCRWRWFALVCCWFAGCATAGLLLLLLEGGPSCWPWNGLLLRPGTKLSPICTQRQL